MARTGSEFEGLAGRFASHHADTTRVVYRRSLRTWTRWCAEQGIHPLGVESADVERWVRHLADRGSAAATCRVHLAALASFYALAVEEGAIAANPATGVRRPKVRGDGAARGLERSQARELLRVAEGAGARDNALVCLLLHCGLRISEALGITVGDVVAIGDHRVVRVLRKGGARRNIALPPPAAGAVAALVERRQAEGPSAPLFVDGSGHHLDRFDAVRAVRRLGRAAGLGRRLSPRMLRRSFVGLALDAGASLRDVQESAGHADPRTTRGYGRERDPLDRFAGHDVAAHLAG